MKKFVLSIISVLFLSIGFFSCNLVSIQDQELADAPAIQATTNGLTLTIYRNSTDTKYIKVYRQDLSATTDDEMLPVTIGTIFPSIFGTDSKSCLLEDNWVFKDHEYQYKVVYVEADGLSYPSEWTKATVASSGLDDSTTTLKYDTTNCEFKFNEDDYTLTLSGTPTRASIMVDNAEKGIEWEPVLAVKTDSISQVFPLNSITDGTTINLRGLLSSEFLNTNITIIGIVGQLKIGTDLIRWTAPAEIPVKDSTNNIIEVKSESGTSGFDYL